MDEFVDRNVKSIDLNLSKGAISSETPAGVTEVQMVQDLHTYITQNNTLETVCVSLNQSSNIVSILDSCGQCPKIDSITISCSEDLSKTVKDHVKKFKQQ